MLVLNRQRDEETVIVVGGKVILTETCVDIRGGKVRTGYTADADVKVYRRELWERMQRDAAAAAKA